MDTNLGTFMSICPRSEDETLPDRYTRLKSELILLHERIEYENQRAKDLKQQQVDDIQTYLSALKNAPNEKSNVVISLFRNVTVDQNVQRLVALNNRIKDLEWTLGIEAGQQPSSSVLSIVKTLEELKVRISILTPDLLARIKRRLEDDRYENKSARSDASNDSLNLARDDKSNGIAEMYELIQRWDSSYKEMPNVINHLLASRQLHEDADRVSRKYNQFMALKAEVEKSLHFQKKFDDLNNEKNNERIESIRQKINSIQEK